ncbi:major capsid protein [Mycobacteroides chelonae]|uniref:major capsid protein n=1 Tax=Mycobacteroides chelonae TaxID=1774 RepID=UPI000A8505E1|nr:major capsid protein [Mycobacteroides chelonae]
MLWTDLITPAELTGFARAAVEDVEREKATLARWLPNTSVADIVVKTVVSQDGNGALAQYRSFDAETPIGSGGKAERKVFELLPLGLKERVSEYDQLRARGDAALAMVLGGVQKAAKRVANAVVDRLEVARGQVLETGSLTIDENDVVQTVNFGRPAGNSVTAATLWSANGAGPIADLIAWSDAYAAVNQGRKPGAFLTSQRVVAALQRAEEIRALVATAVGGTPNIVSIDALNAALVAYRLPPIVIYDRKIRGVNVLSDDRVHLLPAAVDPNTGENELGATFSGQTLEASEPEYGIGDVDQPGLVVGAWKTKDPIGVWVHSNAISMPIMVNPVASMVAKVL